MKKTFAPLFLILLVACSQRELPQQNTDIEPLSLTIVAAPAVVNPGSLYFIAVKASGGSGVDSVRIEVLSPSPESLLEVFWLYDDGGAVHKEDGDQVAYDGVFCQNILWSVETNELKSVIWRFGAEDVDGRIAEPVERNVAVRENSAPVLLKIETPDSLPSGFDGEREFRAEAADSNGLSDIARVSYDAYQNEVLNFSVELDSTETAGIYVQKMDKAFAAGKKGEYLLRFKAVDHSGAESETLERRLLIGNNPPRFLDFVHADSVRQPDEGKMTAFLITALVEDDQSLIDIKNVKMEWKKPDGTFSQNSPFDLYDNGLPWNESFEGWDDGWRGDEKAGDGIYSITGIFDPSQPLGDYELTFYAIDFAGNQSERVTRIVTLYPREGN